MNFHLKNRKLWSSFACATAVGPCCSEFSILNAKPAWKWSRNPCRIAPHPSSLADLLWAVPRSPGHLWAAGWWVCTRMQRSPSWNRQFAPDTRGRVIQKSQNGSFLTEWEDKSLFRIYLRKALIKIMRSVPGNLSLQKINPIL